MSLNEVVNSFNDGREEAWATAICALLRACKADLGGEAATRITAPKNFSRGIIQDLYAHEWDRPRRR